MQSFTISNDVATRIATVCSRGGFISPKAKVLHAYASDGALLKAFCEYYPTVVEVDTFGLDEGVTIGEAKRIGSDVVAAEAIDDMNLISGQYDIVFAVLPISGAIEAQDPISALHACCKVNGRVVIVLSTEQIHAPMAHWLDQIQAFREDIPIFGGSDPSGMQIVVIDKLDAEGLAAAKAGTTPIASDTPKTEEAPAPITDNVKVCRECGCHELDACFHPEHGNCSWSEPDLCSHCKDFPGEAKRYSVIAHEQAADKKKNKGKTPPPAAKLEGIKKITIPHAPLFAMLKKVKEVISKHPTLAVLSNVLVKVRRQDIQLIATDTVITIIATIDVVNDCDYGYEYLLPFSFLYDIVNLINGLDISIEITEKTKGRGANKEQVQHAVITTAFDTFKQDELDTTLDWPALPEFPAENSLGIADDFIVWLNKAVDTASGDISKPAMQKINIDIAHEGLSMASTNAHVVFEKTFDAECPRPTTLLVNTKIAKALKGFRQTSISWSDTHMAFVSEKITIIGTIQEERFPNYRSVFPLEYKGNMRLLLSELTGVMKKASLTGKPATIFFKREIGTIVVETFNPDYNRKVTVRIGADYSGQCEQIIVDPANLLLLLGQIDYVTLNISITAPNAPIVITTDSDSTYRSLIMPLYNE